MISMTGCRPRVTYSISTRRDEGGVWVAPDWLRSKLATTPSPEALEARLRGLITAVNTLAADARGVAEADLQRAQSALQSLPDDSAAPPEQGHAAVDRAVRKVVAAAVPNAAALA